MPNLRKTATAALLVLSSALLPPPATALDPPPPKGEPMRGTWGFSASGTLLPPAVEAPAPVAVVGLITFDPTTRDCSITERVSTGTSRVLRISDSCTYAHFADGRGDVLATFPGDNEWVFIDFVLVQRDREMQLVRTHDGVMEGVAKRQ
jgi:hypothetical protein